MGLEPFSGTLAKHRLKLVRNQTVTLQVNTGLLCNQRCRHCHLDAGPKRKENMSAETVNDVADFAGRCNFEAIDITGGAPELNPHLGSLIEKLSPLAPRIMLRSNLSALYRQNDRLLDLLKANRVVVVASFPSLNLGQADSQRGQGIFEISIRMLQKLNSIGYGRNGGDLQLNLVSNPTGAFLPPNQQETEKRYHRVLQQRWGIVFNHLYNFANAPLGRFRQWLIKSGNFDNYMDRLASNFNPCAVDGLMCRSLVSVSWDGYLFDCDFNLARGLFMEGQKIHVSDIQGPPAKGSPISIANHCYTCTAGSGFT
ncbi:MAG: radical SAM protein [Deltaproteobacteria bacterium SG8_13]|nr:MAG: radical SAM protein [Deltaproteobacteria bacterium SG8_13]